MLQRSTCTICQLYDNNNNLVMESFKLSRLSHRKNSVERNLLGTLSKSFIILPYEWQDIERQ